MGAFSLSSLSFRDGESIYSLEPSLNIESAVFSRPKSLPLQHFPLLGFPKIHLLSASVINAYATDGLDKLQFTLPVLAHLYSL